MIFKKKVCEDLSYLLMYVQCSLFRWDIKWVDDTHALGVFSSPEVAAEALAVRHPTILTRPLNMATPQSKSKARSVLEELLPYKPRPVSCTAPARRLLQRALGRQRSNLYVLFTKVVCPNFGHHALIS